MLQRIITGVVSAALLLALLYIRGVAVDIAIALIALMGSYEMIKAFRQGGLRPARLPIYGMAVLMLPAFLLKSFVGVYMLTMAATMLIMLEIALRRDPRWQDAAASLNVLVSVLAPLTMLFPMIRMEPELRGVLMTLLIFVIALLGDTFAYFIGVLFGRHKMAPAISPKKTWEGSIAGLLGSTGGALLLGYIGSRFIPLPPLWQFAVLGFFGGVAGQLGDLGASLIKRFCGIKDFGSIFPGHGGMLDRLDSIIFVIYVVFGYCLFIGYI